LPETLVNLQLGGLLAQGKLLDVAGNLLQNPQEEERVQGGNREEEKCANVLHDECHLLDTSPKTNKQTNKKTPQSQT
jgi:hypothetical protein